MKKPSALTQLLEDLHGDSLRSAVEVTKSSKAVVYISDEAVAADDGVELTANECALLFANVPTAERLVEALETDDLSVVFFDVTVPPAVLEFLERTCLSVDEE